MSSAEAISSAEVMSSTDVMSSTEVMSGAEADGGRCAYEIRLKGLLGPLLLETLTYAAVSHEPRHTLVVTSGTCGRDLLDVLQLLVDTGVEVESVREVSRAADPSPPV